MKKTLTLIFGTTLILLLGTAHAQQLSERYFRHLRFNNVSPHSSIEGTYEILESEARKTSHYVFKYDDKGQLAEILNNHYHTELRHPLTTPDAYRVVFNYKENIEIRTFFDKNNKQIMNGMDVFVEEHQYDKKGFKVGLRFLDQNGQPMESRWKIFRYEWSRHKKLVVEKRYSLSDEAVPFAPYLDFGTIGILYDKEGRTLASYHLDDHNKTKNNEGGIATIKYVYDERGNLNEWSYYSAEGQLSLNRWGYARGKRTYDENGNALSNFSYDLEGKLINEMPLLSNIQWQKAGIATAEDSVAIKTKSLGYLIALQELKPKLMKDVLHVDLAKRTLGNDRQSDQEIIRETTYDQMIDFAESWNRSGNKFPPTPNNEVVILDIYDRSASVKLISDNWVEYLHLTFINGNWKIINLWWQHKDTMRYSPR